MQLTTFVGQNIDGPALWGYAGGVLGTRQGVVGTEQYALHWNALGQVSVRAGFCAAEVRVRANPTLATCWPDFVFAPNYPLMPLDTLGQYIRTHQHLPHLPAAEQVATEGMSLGDTQLGTLQTLEEMVLHLIRLQHDNDALRARVEQLEQTASQR
jgi:hypothetical protein